MAGIIADPERAHPPTTTNNPSVNSTVPNSAPPGVAIADCSRNVAPCSAGSFGITSGMSVRPLALVENAPMPIGAATLISQVGLGLRKLGARPITRPAGSEAADWIDSVAI